MSDKIAQLLTDTLRTLRTERSRCEAEIQRLNVTISSIEAQLSSAPKSGLPSMLPAIDAAAGTSRTRKNGKNDKGKAFWAARKSKAAKK